jgi:hypothetical protein
MTTRRKFLASATSLATGALAAPALMSHAALGQALRKVKMGSAFTTTTNAAYLMPKYLKPEGIDLEIVSFPSLVQRMQAVASGDVDAGNGGLSATMQIDVKGFPMSVLANGCDGGWMLVANPSIASFADLKGKKIGVQNGSIGLVSLLWKLKHEGLDGAVDLAFMDNQDQPIPLMRGDIAAICCFEPYATLAELQGWGKKLWVRRLLGLRQEGSGARANARPGACEGNERDGERSGHRHQDHHRPVQDDARGRRRIDEEPVLQCGVGKAVPGWAEGAGGNDDRRETAGSRAGLVPHHRHPFPDLTTR